MVFSLLREVEPAREGGEHPSTTPAYRAREFTDADFSLTCFTTLFELFERSARKFAESDCLGYRPIVGGKAGNYVFWTYAETHAKVKAVASALANFGVSAGSKVGVFGANSPEWMLAMQACNRMSLTCVPIYDSLGEYTTRYILQHSDAMAVFVSTEQLPVLTLALSKVPSVKTVVYWGKGNTKCFAELKALQVKVCSIEEFISIGEHNPTEASPPKPDDLCTIMYTSGTTGDPKGVMLTHSALVYQVMALDKYLQAFLEFGEGDVFLSYLPLAHSFDRTAEELFLYFGGAIGYWQGGIQNLVSDITTLKPTMFIGVPSVFDRLRSRIEATMNESLLKKLVFDWSYKRKKRSMERGRSAQTASPLADRLVFQRLKRQLGGYVKLIVVGGSPLSLATDEFLRICFCCAVVQGYGLTETCAGSFITTPNQDSHAGTVGIPNGVVEFRLESVPEMNYNAQGDTPSGEICIRGESNFMGYYKNSAQTAEVIDSDGWFHTGDIGVITGDGLLKVVDRKKNIFKLAQGEYVAVEKLEEIYRKCPAIDQIFVYGNSFKRSLVAVVVPQEDYMANWAAENGLGGDIQEICRADSARQHFLKVISDLATAEKLRNLETVKAVYLDAEEFSVGNNLLTPTFKLKRPSLVQKYQKVIDHMYAELVR